MCKIEGCQSRSVAKDLCAKHYMRERRTGDASRTRKPGRKRDPAIAMHRKLMTPDFGSRSKFSRYIAAMRLLADSDLATRQAVINKASRPNGTINIAKLQRLALITAVMREAERAP
jgi:hypothetical protein